MQQRRGRKAVRTWRWTTRRRGINERDDASRRESGCGSPRPRPAEARCDRSGLICARATFALGASAKGHGDGESLGLENAEHRRVHIHSALPCYPPSPAVSFLPSCLAHPPRPPLLPGNTPGVLSRSERACTPSAGLPSHQELFRHRPRIRNSRVGARATRPGPPGAHHQSKSFLGEKLMFLSWRAARTLGISRARTRGQIPAARMAVGDSLIRGN